jgi:ribosome-interacting GTPase 1
LGQLKAKLAKLRTELQAPAAKVSAVGASARLKGWPMHAAAVALGSTATAVRDGAHSPIQPPCAQGEKGEGFDVQKYGDGRVALIGEPPLPVTANGSRAA